MPAARQLLKVLHRSRSRQVAAKHCQRMADLEDDPVGLARYLGYLGESVRDVESHLGREMGDDERTAFEEGRSERQL